MKETIKFKKYIIEQLMQLACLSLAYAIIVYIAVDKLWEMITIRSMMILLCIIGFRHLLLFPLDLLYGCIEKEVYFNAVLDYVEYQIKQNRWYSVWRFYYSANSILCLVVPVYLTDEEILKMDCPAIDQKVKVCYYRYSKILRSWEVEKKVEKKEPPLICYKIRGSRQCGFYI